MYITTRKPIKCPHCGANPIARILYGMPNMSDELERDIYERKVFLGGCCEEISDPAWRCVHCNTPIYRQRDMDEYSDF